MNGKRIRLAGMIFVLLLFAGTALNAEVYMKQTRRTDPFTVMGQTQPEKVETIVTWFGKNRVRVDTGEETTMIVLGDKKIMYMINHEDMTYAEMPIGAALAMGDIIKKEVGEEGEKAAAMYQQMAQSMMGSMEAKVTPTSETKKIKSWTARKYLIEMSMAMVKAKTEAWATEEIMIDPGLYFMAANAMMAGTQGFDKIVQEMQKVKGMIVYQETKSEVMGATMRMVEEVVEMAEKAAPAGAFEVPKGYKKG